jgi:hypothetical protein
MSDRHAFADAVGALLFEKAEPRLNALLAKHGAADPGEMPRMIAAQIAQQALLETTAANFPQADLGLLGRGLRSFAHPAFLPALERIMVSSKGGCDAFEMTRGIHAAVVLAAFGLPVAPFDLQGSRLLGKPSNDIGTVRALFLPEKTAFVGYSVCYARFYVLLTNCIRTLRQRVPIYPELSDVKTLFEREAGALPPDPGFDFTPGMALFARRAGDRISTAALIDANPRAGSIMLYASWQVDGEPYGAPNAGYLPVPTLLLHAVVNDPAVAAWLSRPVGAPPPFH